ncbi:MAG TPA: ATP-binding cassette domain-containing protein [Candidatus Xenobia bacterium]
MISAQALTKNFEGIRALNGVSFEIEKGEILGFLGPNGAGKTTTMRILTCYFPPTSGTAKVAGFDVMQQSLEVRRRVGYLPENFPVYPEMPVNVYLDFVAAIKGLSGLERTSRIKAVLTDCGLEQVQERALGKLSKGYRQRVGLAQAIISQPPVLILDEPTVGLDPIQIVEIRNVIKRQAERSTVILSTHILQEVNALCNRVIIINKGSIVAVDTPDNLRMKLDTVNRVHIEVDGPADRVSEVLTRIAGVEKVEQVGTTATGSIEYSVYVHKARDVRRDISQAVVGAEMGLLSLHPMDMTLEEVYIQMVKDAASSTPAAVEPAATPIGG